MARVKRGTTKLKRKKNILKEVKGYRAGRKSKKKQAREGVMHAGAHAFDHRRDKKGVFRRFWNVRINAAVRPHDFSYSTFIHALKEKKIGLDRKVLSEIAKNHPDTFKRIVENAK
ncbi:MAG: 50S ribosomal protein L20 [Candidatus Pacebacteria bacterium]|jgi:large subunit ribosomal protein L20|nr:50S ribosomal protein L20 [bacterium]MDP6527647.1 50S ribosomal protein L20 [Candidatus Paceibacterota bacterium]MDP6659437.1 50S ribosomal protein L20 [Candidatus Paceibacterota bacterium]|tara:strand:+ start:3503 stop:3847 length:345 start_codon:yes stop_codon:yes gene_type:complete